MWYLIVSIPDLCTLTYFYKLEAWVNIRFLVNPGCSILIGYTKRLDFNQHMRTSVSVKLRIEHECSYFIDFIKRVGKKKSNARLAEHFYPFFATSLINSIL